jgi:hypothetical protein
VDDNNNIEQQFESQVSEDAFEGDPVLAEYQTAEWQAHWLEELESARKERKKFDERGEKTIKRYADERKETEAGRSDYNIFFANTEIKMAALYARTPDPIVTRRFSDANDDVSRVAANLLQRSITYELETEQFDSKVKQILFDRLVPGVGIGWARLDQTEQEVEQQTAAIDPATGEQVTYVETQTQITGQLADIDYVAWNDFLWSPARLWTDVRWVDRRIPMSKQAVQDRFKNTCPADVLAELPFSLPTKTSDEIKRDYQPKNTTVATVDVHEIWDKEHGLIWWVAQGSSVPLDVQDDRTQFEGFFPTPLPPLGRFTTSTTIPISDFKLVQDQYNELDFLNDRAAKKLQAIRTMFLFDSKDMTLRDLFNAPDLQGIPVKNWDTFQTERGGMRGSIEFIDNSTIVTEYSLMIDARDKVKAQIYEVEGISDIMRGASQMYDSAAATNAKATLGSTRLAVMQKDTAEYIGRLLRLKAHLICKFYQPEFIVKRAGVIAEPDQQYVEQAIALLKDDQLSGFRLLVSTDSIQLPNMNQHKREKSEALQALTALLGQAIPAAQQMPQLAAFVGQAAKWLITDYAGSEQLEGYLDQMIDKMAQQAAQASAQPPKPSEAELKAQSQKELAQVELQKAQIKEQGNVQSAQIAADAKKEVAMLQAQLEQRDQQMDAWKAQTDAQLRAMKLHIEGTRAAHENALDLADLRGGL